MKMITLMCRPCPLGPLFILMVMRVVLTNSSGLPRLLLSLMVDGEILYIHPDTQDEREWAAVSEKRDIILFYPRVM